MDKEVTNSNWIVDDLKQELVRAITDNTEISESGCQNVLTKIADSMILKHRSDAAGKKYQDIRSTLLKLYSGAMLALDGTRLDILFRVVNKDLPKWAQGKVLRANERQDSERADISKLTIGDVKELIERHENDVMLSKALISEGHKSVTRGSVVITITDTK